MWTVIYIAPNRTAAERLKQVLAAEGILVSLRVTGLATEAGTGPVEIMVPKCEAREAHEILTDALRRARFQ